MKELGTGKDKIKQICEILRYDTLEPAQIEAKQIVDNAKKEAAEIIANARREAQADQANAKSQIEKERQVFHSSLEQAAKQSIETLRQEIETKLFNEQLSKIVARTTADPTIIASLINALVKAIENEGTSANFSALIPQTVSPQAVNSLLLHEILNSLSEKSVVLSAFEGGAQIRMHDKRVTLDISDRAIVELLARHIRREFRKWLFTNGS